jgi:hypothetical protein
MRWIRIREAEIEDELRTNLERFGVPIVQTIMAERGPLKASLLGDSDAVQVLQWLTEQYDRAERKETWSLTMEAAITVFVLAELCITVLGLFGCLPQRMR